MGLSSIIDHYVALSPNSTPRARGVRYFVPITLYEAYWGAMNSVKAGRRYKKHIVVRRMPYAQGLLQLYTYHFTIMRSVMEKIMEFFGHFDYRFILDGILYKGNRFEETAFSKGELIDLYSRIVNVFSHQGSFFSPREMNEDNKDSLKTLFYHIKNKYRFILPDLNDERSEKEIRLSGK